MKGREFDLDFKVNAVKLIKERGRSVSQVSQELGVSKTSLYEWLRASELGDLANQFPGKGHVKPQDEELRRLRKEVDVLKRERDILKKAVAIFSVPANKDTPS